jgi:hypothetical protein
MNYFNNESKRHYPILMNDIIVGLILLFALTVISFFFLWIMDNNRTIFSNPSIMDTVKVKDRHINGSVLNYTETP